MQPTDYPADFPPWPTIPLRDEAEAVTEGDDLSAALMDRLASIEARLDALEARGVESFQPPGPAETIQPHDPGRFGEALGLARALWEADEANPSPTLRGRAVAMLAMMEFHARPDSYVPPSRRIAEGWIATTRALVAGMEAAGREDGPGP